MTAEQAELARALSECRFVPATWDKRFARDMGFAARRFETELDAPLTLKQQVHLYRCCIRYRRQLSAELVALARSLAAKAPPIPPLQTVALPAARPGRQANLPVKSPPDPQLDLL